MLLRLGKETWGIVAPEKNILVHCAKARTKYDTACLLTLPSFIITSCLSAHILGVILKK
jgi:hypothetical protein